MQHLQELRMPSGGDSRLVCWASLWACQSLVLCWWVPSLVSQGQECGIGWPGRMCPSAVLWVSISHTLLVLTDP